MTPPGITIRLAALDERTALEALQWRASLRNPGDRDALLANPDAIVLPDAEIAAGWVCLAERNGAIVGFAVAIPRRDQDMELDGLFVEPDLWQSGIGRALVEHCAQAAAQGGARYLHVTGNPHAKGFYSACGFAEIGQTETRFGVGLLMRLPLPPVAA